MHEKRPRTVGGYDWRSAMGVYGDRMIDWVDYQAEVWDPPMESHRACNEGHVPTNLEMHAAWENGSTMKQLETERKKDMK